MNWFERITGFRETSYEETQSLLEMQGTALRSKVNGMVFEVGEFSMPSLAELRQGADLVEPTTEGVKVSLVSGDIRHFLRDRANEGAMFQVASQFNMLEMISPSKRPEDGVTIYRNDPTQGPACAIAAGAATLFRNYLVPCGGGLGQRAERQLDGLHDLGQALSAQLGLPVHELWAMRNGYALCTLKGLTTINELLNSQSETFLDELRGKVRFGVHRGAQVTDAPLASRHLVSQIFCSAMPVAYSQVSRKHWAGLARLVLDAAYEATLRQAVLSALHGGSKVVYLTRLGGGAFGNDDAWIHSSMEKALNKVRDFALDVRIVCYSRVPQELLQMAQRFQG